MRITLWGTAFSRYPSSRETLDFQTLPSSALLAKQTQPKGKKMKRVLSVVGVIFILIGGVWFLQGINVLPGSFMTGQIRWAIYGGIAVAAGIVLIVTANRRRANP